MLFAFAFPDRWHRPSFFRARRFFLCCGRRLSLEGRDSHNLGYIANGREEKDKRTGTHRIPARAVAALAAAFSVRRGPRLRRLPRATRSLPWLPLGARVGTLLGRAKCFTGCPTRLKAFLASTSSRRAYQAFSLTSWPFLSPPQACS